MADAPKLNLARIDARLLRALAHPLRVQLLELLRADGPATASGLGKRLGESSGTTSWHLRQLAEHGLVEEDTERGNRRERWWRSVHEGDHLRAADVIGNPDLAGPLSTFLHTIIEQRYSEESRFAAEFSEWPEEWRENSTFDSAPLSLTSAETHELNLEVRALVDRYRREAREGDSPVRIHWAAFPRRSRSEQS